MRSICWPLLFSLAVGYGTGTSAATPRAQVGKSTPVPLKGGLKGGWSFVADPSGSLKVNDLASVEHARRALVPGPWQSEFDDLRDYAGVAWYWTSLTVDHALPTELVALVRFG